MIRVRVELSNRAGNSVRAEVRAESIERAVRPALESYPGCEIGVLLPIDHEILFVGEATAAVAIRAEAGRLSAPSGPQPRSALWFDFAASGF